MPTHDVWKPVLLNPQDPRDRRRITALRHDQKVRVVDDLSSYLEELYCIRHPESIRTGVNRNEVAEFVSAVTHKAALSTFGMWVYYPWSRVCVHVLPHALHTELRTARNRNLITAAEQDRYYRGTIGVAGLSVGNAVASAIVHTGGGGMLRLADCDTLSGSNTNRIRAGFDSSGLSKVAIICREIYAVDPFAGITAYEEGITGKNIEGFLVHPHPLSVVVDEMDNLYLKIRLRVLARKHRIPVVMAADNGNGIVVDIERFDLDPKRPILHGDIPEKELLAIRPDISRSDAAKMISRWVRPEHIDDRMKESVTEIGKTLYTWPQLGNAAFLAGSVVSYIVRKIIIGDPVREGKFAINPDEYFVPGYMSHASRNRRKKQTDTFNAFLSAA